MKETAWALFLFMSFFTLLTLLIALTDPVSDCGCFGDAIILTNWQTFFKNLIFIIPTIVVFKYRNCFDHYFKSRIQLTIVIALGIVTILLSLHCYYNLPFIDFRPFNIGANIPASMEIPEGMPSDEYETILVYERDGVAEEFKLDSEIEPWNDSTWKWVETKNILVKMGYQPPIHDFTLTSYEGIDITDSVLNNPGYSFLIVSYDLSKANLEGLKRINEFTEKGMKNKYSVFGMTSSMSELVDDINTKTDPSYEFFITDNITLKTMIRSNPGLILIQDGNVIGKWHYRNIPDESFFNENGLSFSLKEISAQKNDYFALLVVAIIGSISLLLSVFRAKKLKSNV
jgi:hypothetical protein